VVLVLLYARSIGPRMRWMLAADLENLERVGRSRHRRCDPGRAHRLLHPRLLAFIEATQNSTSILVR